MIPLDDIAGTAKPGTLYGIGVGPGDVRYLTLRATALIGAVDVIAYFAKAGREGNARRIIAPVLNGNCQELKLEYPVTTELPVTSKRYQTLLAGFYRQSALHLAEHLSAGRSVGLLSEGDPFFYGSFMHMWRRLEQDYPVEVVPGVTGMSGCWTTANTPITWGDDVLTVVPGTLDEQSLTDRLHETNAAVVMKVGRNLSKVRRAVDAAGHLARAVYVERGTMDNERVIPLADVSDETGPYFSMIIIPGEGRRL